MSRSRRSRRNASSEQPVTKQPATKQPAVTYNQDAVLDSIASGEGEARIDHESFHPAMSLHPNEAVMLGFVLGNEECKEIIESWRPGRSNLPVVTMQATEFDALVDSNPMCFVGKLADLDNLSDITDVEESLQ